MTTGHDRAEFIGHVRRNTHHLQKGSREVGLKEAGCGHREEFGPPSHLAMSIRPNGAYVGYARFSSIFAPLSRHIRRGGGRRARVLCPRSRYIVGGRASPNGHRRTLRRGSHPEILRLTTFSTNGLSDDGRVRCLESVADRGEYSFARVGNDDVCDAGGRRTAHSQLKS